MSLDEEERGMEIIKLIVQRETIASEDHDLVINWISEAQPLTKR